MNSFLMNILFQVVQRLVGGDFFENVKELVLAAASTEYKDTPELSANEQRKLAVKKELKELGDGLGDRAKSMGGWLLSLAVDAAVGVLKRKGFLNE